MTATFVPSGVDGAGFQNYIAADPAGGGVVLSCADVAGLHRSTDWGETWTPVAGFAYNTNHLPVAGLAWSTSNPDIVVICTGFQGGSQNGGVWISTDNGATFTQKTSSPTFCGSNANESGVLPTTHPRSVGRVAAIDYSRDLLYVGSYDDGVYRASFDPDTGTCGSFTSIGSLSGKFIRSVAVDESGNQLFVACHDETTAGNDGVFLITTAGGTASAASKIGGAPANPEELLYLDSRVYAVCGGPTTRGVFSCTASSSATWTERSGGLPVTTPRWQALDGWVDGSGNHVLYVGCDGPTTGTPTGGTSGNSIYRCDDGRNVSPTWTTLTLLSDANTPREPLGQVDEWWLAVDSEFAMVNRGGFDCASVALGFVGGTGTPDYLFAAGRAGIWRLDAPTASGSGLNDQWHPAIDGLGVTINRCVSADPTRGGTVFVGNVDWVALISEDAGATVVQADPGTINACFSAAHDPTSGYLVAGGGDRDNNTDGRVFTKSSPGAAWSNTSIHGDGSTARILGVAAATVSSSLVLLAARMEGATGATKMANIADSGGLYRKVGAGAWTQILSPSANGVMDNQGSKEAPFTWPDQGTATNQKVYWYERANGVWRSTDSGASWVRIWATTSNSDGTGYVTADPLDVDRLYISAVGTLYRVNNAGTVAANSASPTDITPSTGTGRMSACYCDYRGYIWACGERTSSQQAALWVSDDHGSTWTDEADDVYRQAAMFPYGLTVAEDDAIYVALFGNGVLVSEGIAATVAGTATIAGAGALTVTGQLQEQHPTTAAAGAGTATIAGQTQEQHPTTGESGAGGLAASADIAGLPTSDLTGAGALSASGEQIQSPTEAAAGAGSLSAAGQTQEQHPTTGDTGTGSATVAGQMQEQHPTTGESGTAAMSAAGQMQEQHPSTAFTGSAAVAATGSEGPAAVSTTISGISRERGSACATLVELEDLPPYGSGGEGIAPVEGSAGFAGGGAVAAAGQITLEPTATFTGAGQTQATTGATVDATAAFSGAALADGQVTIQINPTTAAAGAGTLTVDVPTQGLAELASFIGAGEAELAVGAPTVIVLPTATFTGAGQATVAAGGELNATAAFTGTGLDDGQMTVTIDTSADFAGEAFTVTIGTDILHQQASFFSGTGTAMTTTGTATLRHTAPGLAVIDRHPPNEIARAK